MRFHGAVSYSLCHGEGYAGVISTWSVPYSALLRRGAIEDIEVDGMPELTGLVLKIGDCERRLDEPSAVERQQWLLVWSKESRHCTAELMARFAADCLERFWSGREAVAA